MVSPRLTNAGFGVLASMLAFASACGGKSPGMGPGTGGATGGGTGGVVGSGGSVSSGGAIGSGGTIGSGGVTGTGGGPGGAGSGGSCTPTPASVQTTGVTLKFPVELIYEGHPFVFGEANIVSGMRSVVPLNVRFFVSQAELVTAGGGSVPVDILTESGAMAPYGVFLFNAEDASAQTLYVRAPAGSYEGLKFSVGLTPACNRNGAPGKAYPLSEDSQMTWSMGFGYLFLRYESQVTAGMAPDGGTLPALPRQIHMGGDLRDLTRPSAVTVSISGAFTAPTSAAQTGRIRVAMDQIFKAATSDVDLSDYPLFMNAPIEMLDGERLRRTGGTLPLFVFAP